MTDRPMHAINLECEVCGWQVHALMSGANGTTPERARAELAGRLHWAADGRRCDYCKDSGPRSGSAGMRAALLRECPA